MGWSTGGGGVNLILSIPEVEIGCVGYVSEAIRTGGFSLQCWKGGLHSASYLDCTAHKLPYFASGRLGCVRATRLRQSD